MRLGKALIAPLDDTRGPYLKLDSRGYQILLDYRGGRDPFPFRSIGDVVHHDNAAAVVRGRAVIVGITSVSVNDSFSRRRSTAASTMPPRSTALSFTPMSQTS